MRKTRLWTLLAALALVIGTLGLAACGDDDDNGGSGGGGGGGSSSGDLELKSPGKLTVGTDTPYPPFEFGSAPNYQGFDIEVVNEIAKRLNLDVTYQDTAFDTIFTDLASGSFDMVASASTITPERQNVVDFSDPYYSADQALIVVPGSDIATVEDLADKNVAAQNGTTGLDYAKNETDASNVQGFPQGPDVVNAVRAGQVDAGILDQPVAQDAVEKAGGIEVAQVIPTGELYGLAFPQDSDNLREAFNSELAKMKEDGALDKIYQKYFGIPAPDVVVNAEPTEPAS
jgi:polar amino acid transport system substrate-binding protein